MNQPQENPPRNDDVETFEADPVNIEASKEAALLRDKEEKLFNHLETDARIEQDLKERGILRGSISHSLEKYKDTRTAEEKQITPEEARIPKKEDSSFKKGLKKFMMTLGMTGIMAGAGVKAAATEKNPGDSLPKITTIERTENVAGVTLEGMISVPMTDTTSEYFFVGFSGNNDDEHKIGKMEQAVKALGFELASPEDLKSALQKHGTALVKATGGYGISLKNAHTGVDDTKNVIINNKTDGPETHDLTTFNPTGKIGEYEIEAMEKTGFNYDDYPVFVKKIKQIGPDYTKKSDTVPLPGSSLAKN